MDPKLIDSVKQTSCVQTEKKRGRGITFGWRVAFMVESYRDMDVFDYGDSYTKTQTIVLDSGQTLEIPPLRRNDLGPNAPKRWTCVVALDIVGVKHKIPLEDALNAHVWNKGVFGRTAVEATLMVELDKRAAAVKNLRDLQDRHRQAIHIANVLATRADEAARVFGFNEEQEMLVRRFEKRRKSILDDLIAELKTDPRILDEDGKSNPIDSRVLNAAIAGSEKALPAFVGQSPFTRNRDQIVKIEDVS